MSRMFPPKHFIDTSIKQRRYKKISLKMIERVEGEVKAMLHCHRDTLRNIDKETTRVTFDVREGFHGEAFGIMRGLNLLGYGYFGSDNLDATHDGHPQPETNLKWWFSKLESEVLDEEGYRDGSHRCEYCLEKYKKDDRYLIEQKKLKKRKLKFPEIKFARKEK